ncbi:MAG: bifunctional nuclease family protein [Candidatus Sumerlaeia bacterium]
MLIEMELREICRSTDMNAVVLREKEGDNRQFPIYIGIYEASALEMAIHEQNAPRPLTHDLVLKVLGGMGGKLKRIIVDKLEQDTFFSKLDIELKDHTSAWVDSRPSDALVLASKLKVPIFADESVLDKANAVPSPDDDFDIDDLDDLDE